MKIKFSFITNSSSSAYIVFIPDHFKVSYGEVIDAYTKSFNWFDELDELMENDEGKDKLVEEVQECFEGLKGGESFSYYDGRTVFYTAIKICEENEFVVAWIDLPSDCEIIEGIKENVIFNVLTKHIDIDKFLEPFVKECKKP